MIKVKAEGKKRGVLKANTKEQGRAEAIAVVMESAACVSLSRGLASVTMVTIDDARDHDESPSPSSSSLPPP